MSAFEAVSPHDDVEAVASRVKKLPGYPDFPPAAPAYQHMGALLTDTGLQAAIDYTAVVQPRVRMLLEGWPDATSTDHLGAAACNTGSIRANYRPRLRAYRE